MKSIKNIVCICALSLALFACERETPTPPVDPTAPLLTLDAIAPVSLGYEAANEVKVSVSKIIERSDISVTADDSWVRDISVKEQTISFMVSENPERTRGYRYLNILIKQEGKEIGRCKVYQSRRPISEEKLAFATEKASYFNEYLPTLDDRSGLAMTRFIYNLEKITGGKDNYKNYPAFAFCIDMNYDPENNMEWFLPAAKDVLLPDRVYFEEYKRRYLKVCDTCSCWSGDGGYRDNANVLYYFSPLNEFIVSSESKSRQLTVIAIKKK